jgi:hypothetical protein
VAKVIELSGLFLPKQAVKNTVEKTGGDLKKAKDFPRLVRFILIAVSLIMIFSELQFY